MINLLKKDGLNIGILSYDFELYKSILNTIDIPSKDSCFNDLNNNIIPTYFKDKLVIAAIFNKNIVSYLVTTFNSEKDPFIEINNLFINKVYEKSGLSRITIEILLYVSKELGARSILANATLNNYDMCREFGFYEIDDKDDLKVMRLNINAIRISDDLVNNIRNLPKDYLDYGSIRTVKKISESKTSNIYLTDDGRILKMFRTNSFIELKEKEENLKAIKKLDIKELLKPKNLVYFNGVFVGYIMDYLPNGNSLWDLKEEHNFESKIEKIKELEKVIKKLHSKGIYLSYIDLNNILYDEKGNLKIIDCDSLVLSTKEMGKDIPLKYKDPTVKLISEKTDLYALSVACLELLTNIRIPNNTSHDEVEKIYVKNKNKLPVSFKTYFEKIFKENERCYLSDSYEKYLNEIFNVEDETDDVKSGNVSVIILSIMMVVVAVIGYIAFRIMR